MFLSIWLHFKKCFGKYFLMFGCIFENTIEKTFSTCYSYFLTFSQLPNEYIISFIPKNTNKTQKISHFLGEIVIEIGAISISEIAIAILWSARSRDASIAITIDADRRGSGDHDRDRRRSSSLSFAKCVLFTWVFSFCGFLSLLHVLQKMFEGKTIL